MEEKFEDRDNIDSSTMGFWDHVEELAKSLKIVMYSYIISFVLLMALPGDLSFITNFNSYNFLIAVILRKIRENMLPPNVMLVGLSLTDPIGLYFIAAAIIAAAVILPIMAYRIYNFINPALHSNEKKAVYPFLASVSVLFLAGLAFGYLLLDPLMIRAMLPFFYSADIQPFIDVMSFYTLVLETTLIMGLAFTFPVFLVLLTKFGIIDTSILTKNRKYAYPGLFIATMIITPDGSLVSNILLFAPMVILLEGGILFARRYEKDGIPKFRWFRRC